MAQAFGLTSPIPAESQDRGECPAIRCRDVTDLGVPMSTPDPQWGQPQPAPKQKNSKVHLIGYPVVAILFLGFGAAAGGGGSDGTVAVSETAQDEALATTAAPAAKLAATKAPKTAAEVTVQPTQAAKPVVKPVVKSGPGIGDKVRDGKFEFKVTKVKTGVKQVGDSMFGQKAQGQFVMISMTVKNIGDEAQTLDGSSQTMFDAKGRKFSADSGAAIYLGDSNSFLNDINPGNSVKGVVIFDVPKTVKPVKLELHDSVFSGGVDVSLK